MSDRIEEYVVDIRTDYNAHAANSAAHHDAPDDTAFALTWNGDTDTAPSKNAVFDTLYKTGYLTGFAAWYPENGASWSAYAGGAMLLPISDNNATYSFTVFVPKDWLTANGYLKILYMPTVASQAYSGEWHIAGHKAGETVSSYNILNNDTNYDFAAQAALELGINSVSLGSVEAGDRIGGFFQSDALNNTNIYIYAMWVSPNAGADVL